MSQPPDNPSKMPDRRSSDRFQQHMDERFDALEKLIKSGFPDGNPEEHRKVHERYIKGAKGREKRRDLQLRSSSIAAVYGLRFLH